MMRAASVFSILALSVSVGCGDTGSAIARANKSGIPEPIDPNLIEVICAASGEPVNVPLWAGEKQGIFKRAGFRITERASWQGSDRLYELDSNSAHIANVDLVSMIRAMGEADHDRFRWVGVTMNDPGNEGLVGVDVSAVRDLRGKTIAVDRDSSAYITLALLLKDAGIDITNESDVTIRHGQEGYFVAQLKNGDAEAACAAEPSLGELLRVHGARLLAKDVDTAIAKEYASAVGIDVLCVSEEWVTQDRTRAKRFVRAYFEAVDWCASHPKETAELALEFAEGDERDVIEAALTNVKWLGSKEQRAWLSESQTVGQARVVARVMKDVELIEDVPNVAGWLELELLE